MEHLRKPVITNP